MVCCFENIIFSGGMSKSCPTRFNGDDCEKYCPYPLFGNQCKWKCECRPNLCRHLNGCPSLGKSYLQGLSGKNDTHCVGYISF